MSRTIAKNFADGLVLTVRANDEDGTGQVSVACGAVPQHLSLASASAIYHLPLPPLDPSETATISAQPMLLAGQECFAGCLDGSGPDARFAGIVCMTAHAPPTTPASASSSASPNNSRPHLYVVDAQPDGNQLLRTVAPDGTVATLAVLPSRQLTGILSCPTVLPSGRHLALCSYALGALLVLQIPEAAEPGQSPAVLSCVPEKWQGLGCELRGSSFAWEHSSPSESDVGSGGGGGSVAAGAWTDGVSEGASSNSSRSTVTGSHCDVLDFSSAERGASPGSSSESSPQSSTPSVHASDGTPLAPGGPQLHRRRTHHLQRARYNPYVLRATQ